MGKAVKKAKKVRVVALKRTQVCLRTVPMHPPPICAARRVIGSRGGAEQPTMEASGAAGSGQSWCGGRGSLLENRPDRAWMEFASGRLCADEAAAAREICAWTENCPHDHVPTCGQGRLGRQRLGEVCGWAVHGLLAWTSATAAG